MPFTTPLGPRGIGRLVSAGSPRIVMCWKLTTTQLVCIGSAEPSRGCWELGLDATPGDRIFIGALGTAV
jgi:hypothetical protein